MPGRQLQRFPVVYRTTSDGDFYPLMDEARDGYDTVEWVAAQPWCDGTVGGSYWGMTQLLAAAERPPHLKAVVPFVTPSEAYDGCFFQGGAFQLG
jgi:putative CocE/NonD family hydrolase